MFIATDNMAKGSALARKLGPLNDFHVVQIEHLPAASPRQRVLVCDFDPTNKTLVELAQPAIDTYRRADVPIIFLLTPGSFHETTQAYALGADIIVPRTRAHELLVPTIARIIASSVTRAVDDTLTTLEKTFAAAANGQALVPARIIESSGIMLEAIEATGISNWLNQSWSIDEATTQHCLLVAGFSAAFAIYLGFSSADRLDLTHAAMLHDVGKAKVPPEILNKPERFDKRELVIMQQHPILGWDLLNAQKYEGKRLLDAVLHHHEYLDGTGYPDGLRGNKISDFVRIITICDIFGALLEKRPYKSAHTPETALDIMFKMGTKLDPDLLLAFARFVDARVLPGFNGPARFQSA